MNVLVIDDNPRVAVTVLCASGHAVRTAVTAADGFALLASEPFDAVVLDLGLPDVEDSRAWARAVRALYGGRIVVSSALPPDVVCEIAASIGADALSKPHTRERLMRAVEGG